jgi:hypothetical protein
MNRINKKAVSAVVATVLIIMITVAAVGIIWAAIIPMVRDSLSKGTICNDALSDISIGVEGYTCRGAAYDACLNSSYSFLVTNDTTKCNNVSNAGNLGANISSTKLANISLQIRKGSSAKVDLVAVNALLFKGGSSESIRINKTNTGNVVGNLPGINVEQVITLVGAYANITSVKIAPVVTVGKTEETCAATQEVNLGPCM